MIDLEKEFLEEIKEKWADKLIFKTPKGLWCLRYAPGREYTEGFDYIFVYFSSPISAKIFLNKHHEQCW